MIRIKISSRRAEVEVSELITSGSAGNYASAIISDMISGLDNNPERIF